MNRTLLTVVDHEDADVLAFVRERSVMESHGRVDEIVDELLQRVIIQLVRRVDADDVAPAATDFLDADQDIGC
jgi:hypothetical protein